MKFLRLTMHDGTIKYLNANTIRSFESKTFNDGKTYTMIELQLGTWLVKETPEELMAMIGG